MFIILYQFGIEGCIMAEITLCSVRRLLVTGATGFIGSHLIPLLLREKFQVAIIKRKQTRYENNNVVIIDSDSYESINSGIQDFKPDIVIHLAALYLNKHTPAQIAELIDSNITFGTYILEAMAENNVSKFINIGTQAQHFGNKQYCPVNLYAATKEAFKDILAFYQDKGIQHKTIELFDTYGEGDTRKKIMELLINACRNKEPLDLTPGGQFIDLSSVDDICEFLAAHIKKQDFFDNGTIALSGTVLKLRDLGAMIESLFNAPGILRWGAKQYRENEMLNPPEYYPKVQLKADSLQDYIQKVTRRK
jgi:nucleoside-diphosphate-sugar epimerase